MILGGQTAALRERLLADLSPAELAPLMAEGAQLAEDEALRLPLGDAKG